MKNKHTLIINGGNDDHGDNDDSDIDDDDDDGNVITDVFSLSPFSISFEVKKGVKERLFSQYNSHANTCNMKNKHTFI